MKAVSVALAVLTLALFSACSGNADSSGTEKANEGVAAGAPSSPVGSEMPGADARQSAKQAAVLKVAMSGKYGAYLVDRNGRALYTIVDEESPDGDVAQGAEGRHIKAEVVPCTGACARVWPVYETQGEVMARAKVDPSLIHTFTRADGSTQVVYSGYTLFYYVKDRQPGDILGQGVKGFGGTWYLVAPSGEEIEEPLGETSGSH